MGEDGAGDDGEAQRENKDCASRGRNLSFHRKPTCSADGNKQRGGTRTVGNVLNEEARDEQVDAKARQEAEEQRVRDVQLAREDRRSAERKRQAEKRCERERKLAWEAQRAAAEEQRQAEEQSRKFEERQQRQRLAEERRALGFEMAMQMRRLAMHRRQLQEREDELERRRVQRLLRAASAAKLRQEIVAREEARAQHLAGRTAARHERERFVERSRRAAVERVRNPLLGQSLSVGDLSMTRVSRRHWLTAERQVSEQSPGAEPTPRLPAANARVAARQPLGRVPTAPRRACPDRPSCAHAHFCPSPASTPQAASDGSPPSTAEATLALAGGAAAAQSSVTAHLPCTISREDEPKARNKVDGRWRVAGAAFEAGRRFGAAQREAAAAAKAAEETTESADKADRQREDARLKRAAKVVSAEIRFRLIGGGL